MYTSQGIFIPSTLMIGNPMTRNCSKTIIPESNTERWMLMGHPSVIYKISTPSFPTSIHFTREHCYARDLLVTTGTMFTDEKVTNVWLDVETGLPPQDPFVWFFAEPNSGTVENCAQVWIKEGSTGKTSRLPVKILEKSH